MRRALLLTLVALAGLVLAGCSIDPPKIVAIAPSRDASDVPTDQQIRIAFDRPMNRQSVEQRFEIHPAVAGCDSSSHCGLVWSGNTLVFTHPSLNFALSVRYEVVLHGGYADATGQQNGLEHSWFFTTEGPPALSGVDPPDRSQGVAPDRNIVLTFTRPMSAPAMQTAVTITPQTPFLLRPRPGGDGSQFEIVLTSLLAPRAAYVVVVDGALDLHRNLLPGRVESRFTTGSLSLARQIGYLAAEPHQLAFGIAIVDPHPDPLLGRATPKLAYTLPETEREGQAILAFDWAPDGQRLVLVRAPQGAAEGPLRIVDLMTGETVDLVASGADVAWSPDGSRILYLTRGNIHEYQLAAARDVPLTEDGTVIPPLAFTPDGKSVAFAAADGQGLPRLSIMNLDLHSRYQPIGLTDPADRPAWSFDGTKLAFRRLTPGGPVLTVYDLGQGGSSAYRRVTALDVASVAWLDDNSSVIAAVGTGAQAALYRINVFAAAEAGGVVKVTGSRDAPDGWDPTAPAYDRRVSFVGTVNDLPQIFVMNGDGSHPQDLTEWEADFPYTGSAPNWNPTG